MHTFIRREVCLCVCAHACVCMFVCACVPMCLCVQWGLPDMATLRYERALGEMVS